jgi:hypothetical protein
MHKPLVTITLAAAALLAGCSHPQPVYVPAPPPPPSLNYGAIETQGAHDGFEAAQHDVATNRPPLLEHHPRFRNPPVPPPGWEAYRRGFREGYNRFLHQPPPPPPGV